MATINPYLNFDGNCEEAMNFYKSAFNAQFMGDIMRYGGTEMPHDKAEANKVMHCTLDIGNGNYLMGSDSPSAYPRPSFGTGVQIAIHPANEDEANKIFNNLAAGGNVTMPLEKTFWGALFGTLTDKFGVQWMINYQIEQPQ
jgi:PhnB protein